MGRCFVDRDADILVLGTDRLNQNLPSSTALFPMDSNQLAQYLEQTGGVTKPWLLTQLRLLKLKEAAATLPPEEYEQRLADIHQDLMKLGEWWVGLEDEVF